MQAMYCATVLSMPVSIPSMSPERHAPFQLPPLTGEPAAMGDPTPAMLVRAEPGPSAPATLALTGANTILPSATMSAPPALPWRPAGAGAAVADRITAVASCSRPRKAAASSCCPPATALLSRSRSTSRHGLPSALPLFSSSNRSLMMSVAPWEAGMKLPAWGAMCGRMPGGGDGC